MNIYFNPRQLPELKNLAVEQRQGVVRAFFGDRFLVFGALVFGIGLGVALIMTDFLDLSYWPRWLLSLALPLCSGIAFANYEIKRLRPNIADYVFIHFQPKTG